jgi:hypothetical protein
MSPQATRLEPKAAKPGTILTITGVALDKSRVEEVYLTDHRFDVKVKVLEQTDKSLKVRVPPFVKAGRQQLLFLTAGQPQSYLEQPLYVLVEIDEDSGASAKAVPPKIEASAPAAVGNNHPDTQD